MSSFRFKPADFVGVIIDKDGEQAEPLPSELAHMSDVANKRLEEMEKSCEVVHGIPGTPRAFGWTRRRATTDTHRCFLWRPEKIA